MNELKKYAEMKASKQKEMSDLVDKVKKEERAMTPEEDELFNQLEKDINSINETVAKINKSRKLTENDETKESEGSEMDEEKRELTPEEIEKREIEDLGRYIRNEVLDTRDASTNFNMGAEGQILNGSANKIQGCKEITKIHEVSTPAITYDDLVKTKNKVIQAYRKGSIWVMNQDTATALELIKDANDRPLFQADPTSEFDGKVLGYPVYVSDNMAGIEAGKRPIIFGNFSGIALKKTKDLEIQVLRELYATQHATGIVGWLEVDARIENHQKLSALDIKANA